jgi:hypothetical protein
MMDGMDEIRTDRAEAQLRAGAHGRLNETYDAAESVPTQLERGTDHAAETAGTATQGSFFSCWYKVACCP